MVLCNLGFINKKQVQREKFEDPFPKSKKVARLFELSLKDFNKLTRFGLKRGSIRAADQIAELIQRAHSAQTRASGMEKGTDLIQDVSIRTGGFFSVLSRAFAKLTNNSAIEQRIAPSNGTRKNNSAKINMVFGKL